MIAPETLFQLAALFAAWALAWLLSRTLRPVGRRLCLLWPPLKKAAPFVRPLAHPLFWLVFTAAFQAVFRYFSQPAFFLRSAVSLLAAWLVIRLISQFIRNRDLARLFAIIAWTIAALNISGLFDVVVSLLDAAAITLGDVRVSALDIFSAILTFALLVWLALVASRLLEQSLARVPTLTPSAQVLLGKLAKIFLVIMAILIAINSAGIDLTALAVFSGALGLGIGFGLQRVFSNLISGVLLLMDRSIKPGDVIELDQGQTYGWINKLAARYTSVITRDGREHLIPNEDMVTQTVINWTYSSTQVRRHIPIRLSYRADLRRAMDLILEAAVETKRVLAEPDPRVLIKEFGEDAMKLELRIWIADPHNGVSNVASDVLLRVWDKFRENEIEIPYPQHDLHLKSAPALDPEVLRQIILGKGEVGS